MLMRFHLGLKREEWLEDAEGVMQGFAMGFPGERSTADLMVPPLVLGKLRKI